MAYLNEKVSYLKGLAEGLDISDKTPEGKLLLAILDVMQEISDEVEVITSAQDELAEDVAELMECCAECEYDDTDDYFEIECEKCGEIITLTDEMLDSEDDLVCPSCGEVIEIEFCCDCEDGDCESCGD